MRKAVWWIECPRVFFVPWRLCVRLRVHSRKALRPKAFIAELNQSLAQNTGVSDYKENLTTCAAKQKARTG